MLMVQVDCSNTHIVDCIVLTVLMLGVIIGMVLSWFLFTYTAIPAINNNITITIILKIVITLTTNGTITFDDCLL